MTPLLSVALIVRNEEVVLPRVLSDIEAFADEVVVVDTGSTDATLTVCKSHNLRLFQSTWRDDFSAARNESFERCNGKWIMWLDADDRIPSESAVAFRAAKARLDWEQESDVVYVPYRLGYSNSGSDSFGTVNMRIRVVRRRCGFPWVGNIHESLQVGEAQALWLPNAWVEHRPMKAALPGKLDRDRRLLEAALARGERTPTVLLHYGLLLAKAGSPAAAAAVLEECLIVCHSPAPRYAAIMGLSACLAAQGDHLRRMTCLFEALELDSRRAEAFVELGHTHFALGQWRAAVPFFRAAIGLSPPLDGSYESGPYTWGPYLGLARCAARAGEDKEVARLLALAIDAAPHLAEELKSLAMADDVVEDESKQSLVSPTGPIVDARRRSELALACETN